MRSTTRRRRRPRTRGPATIAAVLGRSPEDLLILDVARNPDTARAAGVREPVTEARQTGTRSWTFVSQPYVATDAILARFGIDPSTIDPATDLLTTRAGTALLDVTQRPDPTSAERVERVGLSPFSSAPSSLITESALERHGWQRTRAGWLLEMDEPLTERQIAAAREAAANVGLAIETRRGQDDLAALRTGAVALGGAIALAVIAMTVGLIRSEASRDVRTLTASGAAPRTRRDVTATTAGALAVLGALLGASGAYAALVAGFHADLGRLAPVPLGHLVPIWLARRGEVAWSEGDGSDEN